MTEVFLNRERIAREHSQRQEGRYKAICRATYPTGDKVYCLLDWEECNPNVPQEKCRGVRGK